MNILINYIAYSIIIFSIFLMILSFYFYYTSQFASKFRQYKRLLKKLDYKLENAARNCEYRQAEKYYRRLEKVKRIWEGV